MSRKKKKPAQQNMAAKQESVSSQEDLRAAKKAAILGTNEKKPFLDAAPYLIVVFAEKYGILADGSISKNYYVNESVGIAIGLLVSAVHNAGLASVTYTPLHMKFLNGILKRPKNERPCLILPVGYPKEKGLVPNLKRKTLDEITSFY